MKTLGRLAAAAFLAVGALLVAAPQAQAPIDLGTQR